MYKFYNHEIYYVGKDVFKILFMLYDIKIYIFAIHRKPISITTLLSILHGEKVQRLAMEHSLSKKDILSFKSDTFIKDSVICCYQSYIMCSQAL